MPVPSSGAISLNQFHVEAGGTSGTLCTINDSDIRALIGKASGVTMSFNEWYGASSANNVADITAGSIYQGGKYPATYYGYNDGVLGSGGAFGTAHDNTIRAANGTDIVIKCVATANSTIGNFAYLYIAGNYNGQTIASVFGGSQIKFNSTVIASYTTQTFNYNATTNASQASPVFVAQAPSSGRYNNVDIG